MNESKPTCGVNDSKPFDGGPAFPFKCQGQTTGPEIYYGMSLRDWFAGNDDLTDWNKVNMEPAMMEALAGRKIPECVKSRIPNSEQDWLELLEFLSLVRAKLRYMRSDAMVKARGQ